MPLWVASIIGALIEVCGTLVGRVLVSLGIGYAVYSGIDTSILWAKSAVLSALGGIGAVPLQIIGHLRTGSIISILSSAFIVRMTLQGLTNGSIKRMVQK